MAVMAFMRKNLQGVLQSVIRFPLTAAFLLAFEITYSIGIEHSGPFPYERTLLTFAIGAALALVSQQLYEHFFKKPIYRWSLYGVSVLITLAYHFLLNNAVDPTYAITIKTLVSLFALVMAFIWIPSISSRVIAFHQTFFITFKAALVTLLFAGVLNIGITAIIVTVNQLLFELDFNWLNHLSAFIWVLFAPLYLLAQIPFYPPAQPKKRAAQGETAADTGDLPDRQILAVPRFLEVLLTYIVIPLTVVYTLILFVYVLLNIAGDFWTNNLLEPLLVSYAIVGIVVYLLACSLDSRIIRLFRLIFPKILLVVVLFQTIASVLKIQEAGITHGRYYVILFGIFAFLSSLIFSFLPLRRNGWIVPILLVFVAISILPPIDAFTVSRNSQFAFLEEKLRSNAMLQNGEVIPNAGTPAADKIAITEAVNYMAYMEYLDEVAYLPDDFDPFRDFEQTFGFAMTYEQDEVTDPVQGRFARLDWENDPVLPVGDYDYFFHLNLSNNQTDPLPGDISFGAGGSEYVLRSELTDANEVRLTLREAVSETVLWQLEVRELLDRAAPVEREQEFLLSLEEAAYTVESGGITGSLVLVYTDMVENEFYGEFYLLLDIAE